MSHRQMLRVLHGPVNVGNHPWVLSRAERAQGERSDLVVNYQSWLKYPADRCLGQLGKRSWQEMVRRFSFGLSAPLRYNVLHYYFGRSFWCWDDWGSANRMWHQDLRLARMLNRKVFMTLQGCDARLAEVSDQLFQHTPCRAGRCQAYETCRAMLDEQRRSLINDVLPLCHRVFALNPDLMRNLPSAQFLPYANVEVESIRPIPPKLRDEIHIVHAPSDPHIKGTLQIVQAVDRLKREFPIRFTLVQGLEHAEAMKIYEDADLVIDQLFAGWYGGFAVECMALGKPVACYIRQEDLEFIPEPMRQELPLISIDPENIDVRLAHFLRHREQWASHSRRSREYVLRWHNPRTIGRAMIAAYRDPKSRFQLQVDDTVRSYAA